MAKKLNRNLVGILTLVGMVLLAVGGFALLASLPGQDPKVYEAEAEKLRSEGKFEMAADTLVRAYQRDPAKNPEYLVKGAKCVLEEGKIGKARAMLRDALQRDPNLKSALEVTADLEFEIAQRFGSSAQWNRVLTSSKKLAAADANSALAQHAMGMAYLALQGEDSRHREEGVAALKKALELDPTNAKAVDTLAKQWWNESETAKRAGKLDESDALVVARDTLIADTIEKCRAAAPEKVTELRQLQCIFKIVSKKVDEGIRDLEEIVKSEVKGVDAHRLLGGIYMGVLGDAVKQDLAKAEALYLEALSIEPDNGDVYLELARVYRQQREKSKDPEEQKKLREKELGLYKKGLEVVTRTTDFRKLKNNVARAQFYSELVLGALGDADQSPDEEAREKGIASAESWLARMKEEIDPGQLEVRFLVANILNMKGEIVEATKEAEAAERAAGSRGHLGLQVLLGEVYSRQQQWGAAESAIKKALTMNPDSPGLILRLAQLYLQQNKANDALTLLKPMDSGQRGQFLRTNPAAARLRADALRQLGQYEQALAESARSGTGSIADEVREAQLLILSEKTAEAEKKLKTLLASAPTDIGVLRTLCGLYRDTNRLDEATAVAKAALQKEPDNRQLKILEIDLLPGGSSDERKARTLKVINEEKDEFVKALSLHDFYNSDNNESEARKYLDEAERLRPDHSAVIERQFRLAVMAKDWSRAEKYAAKSGSLNIDGTEGLLSQGRLALAKGASLEEEGKADQAKEQFERAIDLIRSGLQKYSSNSLAWTVLADAYQAAGRGTEAKGVLLEALKMDPTNGFANRALAELSIREGNEAEAQKYLMAASRTLPNDVFVQRQLQILKEKENPREGIKSREKILQENPHDLQNLVLLARLYALPEVAKFDKAAEVYRMALTESKNDLAMAFEFANFLGRSDVKRPSEGDQILGDLMGKEQDKAKKAQIAIYLGRFYENQKVLATADRHFRLAVSLDPSATILQSAGEYYARTSRFRDSTEYYVRALKQLDSEGSAQAEQVRSKIIALCLAVGDLERARTAIDEFLTKYPNNDQGMIFEGAYHRIAGDVQQARQSFDAHIERNPDNAVALWQRGELFRLMGGWQKAISDLTKAKTISPNGFSFQHRISLADVLMETGKAELAVSELRTILDENPDEEAVAEALIDLYIRIGPSRYPDAETLIFTFAQKRPRDEKWQMILGRLYEKARNDAKAIAAYEKAAELSHYGRASVEALFRLCRSSNQPKVIKDYAAQKLSSRLLNTMPGALSTVAWAYLQSGEQDKAIEYYDMALAAAANEFDVYTSVVMEMVQSAGREECLKRQQKRVEADPQNIEQLKLLVQLLHINDKVDDAIAVTEQIEKLAARNEDILFARLAQGMLSQRAGKLDAALAKYEEALKLDPNNALALNNLAALLCEEMNRCAEGLPYAVRARKIRPNDPNVLDTLGWALVLNDRLGEALGVFLRSLEVNREHVITLYHLGLLHERRNEYDEAQRRLEQAKKAAESQGSSVYLPKIVKALEDIAAKGK
ncbi:MAG: tetratricopeptide repeat protein [Planctomycetia bacterium]|nr:tetratricopeptide repeat protein [Planctomycetia bacterium]MCC7314348.1 tetratricopeptide repeat protein [Planctomycetota bacterium]